MRITSCIWLKNKNTLICGAYKLKYSAETASCILVSTHKSVFSRIAQNGLLLKYCYWVSLFEFISKLSIAKIFDFANFLWLFSVKETLLDFSVGFFILPVFYLHTRLCSRNSRDYKGKKSDFSPKKDKFFHRVCLRFFSLSSILIVIFISFLFIFLCLFPRGRS